VGQHLAVRDRDEEPDLLLRVSPSGRLVLLLTSPRVAVGLLSAEAWTALRAGPLFATVDDADALTALVDAGVDLRAVSDDTAAAEVVRGLLAAIADAGTATWWVGAADDARVGALRAAVAAVGGVTVTELRGSWDLPGARLLDVVTTMDRLRSPGGCPWDAKQDHNSLAPYLLEEAYEAFQAIEDRDLPGLRGELGDVLLQVAFHARLAEELPEADRWTIDDVATGLVEKLVRRHPHVFAGVSVADADEVNANWESIKAAERGGASALANVPLAAAALTLAATLQRKAARSGVADLQVDALPVALAAFEGSPSSESAGQLLWSLVQALQELGIDAEQALRARARDFRDRH
jgi:XTP/dITP diphosphohydrolase